MAPSLLVSSATLPSPTLLNRAGERKEGQGREGAGERKEGPSKAGVARSAYSCLLSLNSSLCTAASASGSQQMWRVGGAGILGT